MISPIHIISVGLGGAFALGFIKAKDLSPILPVLAVYLKLTITLL